MRIVKRDRQAPNVRLHLFAQFRNQALRGFREKLGEGERRDALNNRGCNHGEDDRHKQIGLVLFDDVVKNEFGCGRHCKANDTVNDNEHEADRENCPSRLEQSPRFRERFPRQLFLLRLLVGFHFGIVGHGPP